jgi:hypothetical protein
MWHSRNSARSVCACGHVECEQPEVARGKGRAGGLCHAPQPRHPGTAGDVEVGRQRASAARAWVPGVRVSHHSGREQRVGRGAAGISRAASGARAWEPARAVGACRAGVRGRTGVRGVCVLPSRACTRAAGADRPPGDRVHGQGHGSAHHGRLQQSADKAAQRLRRGGFAGGLACAWGSDATFHRAGRNQSSIDHVFASPLLLEHLSRACVLRRRKRTSRRCGRR